MQSELNGVTRPIVRNHRGVVWCPFCDTSSMVTSSLIRCPTCTAKFIEVESADIIPERQQIDEVVNQPTSLDLESGDVISDIDLTDDEDNEASS